MPVCPLCPGRYFNDDDAVRMHRESKHTYPCGKCSRVLYSQQALDQHTADSHYAFECRYCDRDFTTDNGRLAHEKAKHSMFECRFCDREFATEHGRDAHEEAKHPTFECHHCDRAFNSEEARQQHEDAKHLMFECRVCDRKFATEHGRDAHEETQHPTFECHFCDREFDSEDGRQQHEDAAHCRKIACSSCDRLFASEEALSQHREAKHYFKCRLCSMVFTRAEALQQHEQTTPHIECGYCTLKFFTQDAKSGHEQSCGCNPNHVRSSQSVSIRQFAPFPSNKQELADTIEEGFPIHAVPQCADEESVSPTSLSPSSVEGEMFHSTGDLSSADATGEGATDEQACACSICQRTSSCGCSICHQSSSVSSDEPVSEMIHHNTLFQCTPCLKIFETAEAFRDHVCASLTTMLRPHCPVCYSQFDDEPSLRKHLEVVEFTCQLCQLWCCSEVFLQDHLLSHPTCGKCDKSFIDNHGLCVHVESDHPVVVCWDCDGVIVEKNSLESHYTDSPVHPSCAFCGLGKKNSADMDEHIKRMHTSGAEIEDRSGGGHVIPGEESSSTERQLPGEYREDAVPQSFEEVHRAPPSSVVETTGALGGPSDEFHDGSSQMEPTLPPSSQPIVPPHVEPVNGGSQAPCIASGEESLDVDARQYTSPSPTPSEHGSSVGRLQLHTSQGTSAAINNDTRPPSPVSSDPSESFPDTSTRHSPTSDSSHSIVFVSADGIPDYIRENRAILVATSADSHSSGTPLRLSSSSSLASLGIAAPRPRHAAAAATASSTGSAVLRLHCRICCKDPCEDMTATICGHLFCKRCITQAVVAKSECPVCGSATLLYCLFKLDLSV